MKNRTKYQTKQRTALLNYLLSRDKTHVTANQISSYFAQNKLAVGRTTVYRLLNELCENNQVRKYIVDGVSGACYQYAQAEKDCDKHLHLKCEKCGELFHLECEALYELEEHVRNHHAFQVDATKTVLYGKCDNCLKNES